MKIMTTVIPQLLTAADFWLLPEYNLRRELVRGEVRESMPTGGKHGFVAANLITLLSMWAKSAKAGTIGTEAGFRLETDPDTVRSPDVYFFSQAKIPAGGVPEEFWNLAPDLAVEVVSPSKTANEIQEKVNEYLNAGTSLVWVIYPRTAQVAVYTPNGSFHILQSTDELTDPKLLPGFTCRVAELFA